MVAVRLINKNVFFILPPLPHRVSHKTSNIKKCIRCPEQRNSALIFFLGFSCFGGETVSKHFFNRSGE